MKISKKIIILATVSILIIVGKPYIEDYFARFMGFVAPNGQYTERMINAWSNKSTDFLINQLAHPSIEYSGVAKTILVHRKDISKVSRLLEIIHSSKEYRRRYLALSILFVWDEPKAIAVSMEILVRGRQSELFYDALLHLGKRKHAPAYEYALNLAKESDRYTNGSVACLEDFGRAESLPILEEMLTNAKSTLDKRVITNAIQSIKEKNGIK